MKKIKVQDNIDEILEAIKLSDYSYSIRPSVGVTWVIIDEDKKVIRFEYGDDVYDFDEVQVGFLNYVEVEQVSFEDIACEKGHEITAVLFSEVMDKGFAEVKINVEDKKLFINSVEIGI